MKIHYIVKFHEIPKRYVPEVGKPFLAFSKEGHICHVYLMDKNFNLYYDGLVVAQGKVEVSKYLRQDYYCLGYLQAPNEKESVRENPPINEKDFAFVA